MDGLAKLGVFYDNGKDKRVKENFHGVYFNNLDFSKRESPISFYRSDFRGAKFSQMIFVNNNFSNSDFIDSYIFDSKFKKCIFKYSELYNSYVEKTEFLNSEFSSASLVKIIFSTCDFNGTKFKASTIRESKFINCRLKNNLFDKNSIDDIIFEDTQIEDIDLSSMTAINLFFNSCQLKNITIDADYLGSYFFKNCELDEFKLKYRGKFFNLDINQIGLMENLFSILMINERYYEALNIFIQINAIKKTKESLFELFKEIYSKIVSTKIGQRKEYQMEYVFKILNYYINTDYILINDYFKIIGFLEVQDIEKLDIYEEMKFTENINQLKQIILKINFSSAFLLGINSNKIYLEIKIEEDNKTAFEHLFKKTMIEIGKSYNINNEIYTIVGEKKGSIIYQIITYSIVGLMFLKILHSLLKHTRKTLNEAIHIAIDCRINMKLLTLVSNLKGKEILTKLIEINKLQLDSNNKFDNHEELKLDNLKQLIPIIKSAIIYPNALNDGAH